MQGIYKHFDSIPGNNPESAKLLVCGTTGTIKVQIEFVIIPVVYIIMFASLPHLMSTISKGRASFLVRGGTAHSVFSIGRSTGHKPASLCANRLNTLRNVELVDLKAILIGIAKVL